MRSRLAALLLALVAMLMNPGATRAVAEPVADEIRTLLGRDGEPLMIAGEVLQSAPLLRELYAARAWRPLWSDEALSGLISAIGRSEEDGLRPDDYLRGPLLAAIGAPAVRELLATEALARLAYSLRFGKANPAALDVNWNYSRSLGEIDPAAWITAAITGGALESTVLALRPAGSYYATLREALARYRAIAAAGGWRPVPAGPKLEAGMVDARVAALRERLRTTGELAADAPESLEFDAGLATAVKAFQRRHGLVEDGVVGPATLAALNVPVEERIDQLRVNLERIRWVFGDLEEEFLVVNIASFEAAYFTGGAVRWRARAIVGRPYRQTPIFKARMTYLELNPTWTVPPTILANDVLPALRKDPGYLRRERMEVLDRSGKRVDPAGIDWHAVRAKPFPYILRQAPGPNNALGRIKFMFPNPHAVYLHDTPARDLFARAERSFSSGCIRIESPLELAALLLRDPARWSVGDLEAAIATGRTRRVDLPQPVTVMLLYLTAFGNREAGVQFRRDIYGRDAAVRAALDAPFAFALPARSPLQAAGF